MSFYKYEVKNGIYGSTCVSDQGEVRYRLCGYSTASTRDRLCAFFAISDINKVRYVGFKFLDIKIYFVSMAKVHTVI